MSDREAVIEALSSLGNDNPCYVPGIGEVTLGDVRASRGDEPGPTDEDDATVRMWCLIALYDRKAKPWRTGRIRIGSKTYPASVCTSDRFFPLSTTAADFADVDPWEQHREKMKRRDRS